MKASRVLFYLLLFLALYLLFRITVPFISALFWAAILAVAFHPINTLLRRLLRYKTLSALLCTFLVIAAVVLPIWLMGKALVGELSDAYKALEEMLSHGKLEEWLDKLEEMPLVKRVLPILNPGSTSVDLKEFLLGQVQKGAELLSGQVLGIFRKLSSMVFQLLIAFVAVFYLFRDGDLILERLKGLLPLERGEAEELLERVHKMILSTLYGGLLVALVQGGLGGLGFFLVGLPSPIFWGMVMALLSLLPIVGAYLVWVPAAFWLFFGKGQTWHALFLFGWGLGVVSTIDNLLRPLFIGTRTKVHPLLLFFAILGGIKAFGIIGVVAAPVIVAFALAMLDFYTRPKPPSQPGTE